MVLVECGCHCCTSFRVHVRFAAAFRVVKGGECFGTSRCPGGVKKCNIFSNGYYGQVLCGSYFVRQFFCERDMGTPKLGTLDFGVLCLRASPSLCGWESGGVYRTYLKRKTDERQAQKKHATRNAHERSDSAHTST